jgi:basic membrane protein A
MIGLGFWVVVALVAIPQWGESGLAPRPAQAQGELQIGLVTDIGMVDDRSFNQSAWEGVKLAGDELNAAYDFIETTDPADYTNNLRLFAEREYDIIVTTGAAIGDAAVEAAKLYPDTYFILVDVNVAAIYERLKMKDPLPNVSGLIFPEDRAGFLAGFLAARLSRSGIVAAVLPTDQIQPVVNFKNGFEAGVKFGKPSTKLLATYYPGGLDVSFEDPAWGAQTAAQAIDQGADVIFSGGGKTGNGGLQEVAKRTTEANPLYCIGVDTDQWFTVPEAQPCLVTSALKKITDGVAELIRGVAKKTATPGNFVGEVGLASFHDFDTLVTDALKKELAQIEAELSEGKLKSDGTRP